MCAAYLFIMTHKLFYIINTLTFMSNKGKVDGYVMYKPCNNKYTIVIQVCPHKNVSILLTNMALNHHFLKHSL